MKMTFRWYGENDPVTLDNIRQIPNISGIVSAIYDVPVGEVWGTDKILEMKNKANEKGLEFEVVESVPVHEDIKLGNKNRDKYIENYCENIRRLGKAGVKVVCYNFMPVFDWLRSDLDKKLPDGSNSLSYNHESILKMNPLSSELSLPGWDESYTKEELKSLLKQYEKMDEERLFENLEYFLKAVIPVAEHSGIKMAIHSDDPPWSIFGLPRIITNEKNIEHFLKLVDSPSNGITFCTGSLGTNPNNDLIKMIDKFGNRIYFAHIRNIEITEDNCFREVAHPTECGSLDIYGIVKALQKAGFNGYIRPDHGRMIWGEKGRYGYGLYDRALGAVYLTGLWEGIKKSERE